MLEPAGGRHIFAQILVTGDIVAQCFQGAGADPCKADKFQLEIEPTGGGAHRALQPLQHHTAQPASSVKLEAILATTGIRTHFGRDADLKTTVKLRIIGRQQQLLRLDFENTPKNELLASQTAAFENLLPSHDAILFSDYGKGGLAHVGDMIAHARAQGKPILIDPKGTDYSRYQNANVITPNRAELQQVVGEWTTEEDLTAKAQQLREQLHLDAVLLTRSEEGMTLFDAQGQLHVSAQAREVFDVTGAGDTVIATLATLVGSGLSLRQALPWANRAGGLVVGKFGTATVTYEELFG